MGKPLIYEKPKSEKSRDGYFIAFIIAGLTIEVLYFYGSAPQDFWKLTLVDIANVVAQLATAGAFYLGFHQYRRGLDAERQNILAAECKSAVAKMVVEISRVRIGDETHIKNIVSVANSLGNLASDFDVLFDALSEGVNKAIVRMHWQSMYFNEFRPAFLSLDLWGMIPGSETPTPVYDMAIQEARRKVSDERVIEGYRQFVIFKYVMQDLGMKGCGMRKPLAKADIFLLDYYFFESEANNDYLYGVFNQLDIRAIAPLLAAFLAVADEWRDNESAYPEDDGW
jgi:hypothetical protein